MSKLYFINKISKYPTLINANLHVLLIDNICDCILF